MNVWTSSEGNTDWPLGVGGDETNAAPEVRAGPNSYRSKLVWNCSGRASWASSAGHTEVSVWASSAGHSVLVAMTVPDLVWF